jgi:uncharacterized protein
MHYGGRIAGEPSIAELLDSLYPSPSSQMLPSYLRSEMMVISDNLTSLPFLNTGLGFRAEMEQNILAHRSDIDWLEIIAEHYMSRPPERVAELGRLGELFPLIPHGVEMSIGTTGDLDTTYVKSLAEFVHSIRAPWFSDHLSFTKAGEIALGQLTPLFRTREMAKEVAMKAKLLQSEIGLPFLLENITYYFEFKGALTEADFIVDILEQCECGLLLDLTNVLINSLNHNASAFEFLECIPLERVVQIHLSGGKTANRVVVDSHSDAVPNEVFNLLRYVVPRSPALKGVMIERDQEFPDDFGEIISDLRCTRNIVTSHRQVQ